MKIDNTLLTDSCENPALTPFASNFPTANIAMDVGLGFGYNYIKTNSADMRIVGIGTVFGNYTYTDEEILRKFPFTYNDTYSDSFKSSSTTNILNKGKITVKGVGYGKLILPGKTYNNTLKVWSSDRSVDEFSGVAIQIQENNTYEWFDANIQSPILTINIYTLTDLSDNSVSIDTTVSVNNAAIPIGIIETNPLINFSLSPNPFHGTSYISYYLNESQPVKIKVLNSVGQAVFEKEMPNVSQGNHIEILSLESITPGFYFLNLSTNNHTATKRFIVKH